MEEEIHPADEEDEALLNEASECGTSQQDKREETKDRASGAKRTLELHTESSGHSKDSENTKKRREDAKIHPVYLTPRDPTL